ncbi:MAG: hypothetical protein PH343_00455 [Nitrospira sp.]|nr:hypothetical protein [Nitrospira sp.]
MNSTLEKTTHICMPELSISGLIAVRMSLQSRGTSFFHYDVLPRYLRGAIRILKISRHTIESMLSLVAGMPVIQVKQGDEVKDYNHYHIKMQQVTTAVVERLIPEIEKSFGLRQMSKQLGMEPALSYSVKRIADAYIFKQLVAFISCRLFYGNNAAYIAVWNCSWPEKWLEEVRETFTDVTFDFFMWPRWYVQASRLLLAFQVAAKLFMVILMILKQGISFRKTKRKRYKIITEFIDSRRMNNTCYDADYWIDGEKIRKSDVLFFLTDEQKKTLEGIGFDISKILHDLRVQGYEIESLSNLLYPPAIVPDFFSAALGLVKCLSREDNTNTLMGKVFKDALREYILYYPLFSSVSADYCIYLTFPNGHTGLRLNSGIITALCRKNGIQNIGCQTRAVHSTNYEYCYDCHDLYFSWGEKWYTMLGQGMRYIRQWDVVGCINLDYLSKAKQTNNQIKKTEKTGIQVCIFPTDISPRHHYSLNYALRFMVNCAMLASVHPDVEFVVKSKEPQYTSIICAHEDFMEIFRKTKGNLRFEDRPRHGYVDLLISSDIIIAVGFTTPGFEGLMLNKRVIYYNELRYGGQVYREIPDLIAEDYAELERLFKMAVNDYDTYSDRIAGVLKGVEPFRDGKALERINGIMRGSI